MFYLLYYNIVFFLLHAGNISEFSEKRQGMNISIDKKKVFFYYTFGSLDEVHKSVKNLMLSYSKKKFLCLLGLIIFKFHEA